MPKVTKAKRKITQIKKLPNYKAVISINNIYVASKKEVFKESKQIRTKKFSKSSNKSNKKFLILDRIFYIYSQNLRLFSFLI